MNIGITTDEDDNVQTKPMSSSGSLKPVTPKRKQHPYPEATLDSNTPSIYPQTNTHLEHLSPVIPRENSLPKDNTNPLLRDLDNILRDPLSLRSRSGSNSSTESRKHTHKGFLVVESPKNIAFLRESGLDGDIVTVSPVSSPSLESFDDIGTGGHTSEILGKRGLVVTNVDSGSGGSGAIFVGNGTGNMTVENEDLSDNENDSDIAVAVGVTTGLEEQNDKEDVDDEDDEDGFVNVDEIDGPITVHVPDKVLRRDHDGRDVLDYNLLVNEEFQRTLDKRAAELENGISSRASTQLKVDWDFQDFANLEHELDEWFCASDYSRLLETRDAFSQQVTPGAAKFMSDDNYARTTIASLVHSMTQKSIQSILSLTYISLGDFAHAKSLTEHLNFIRRNNLLLGVTDLKGIVEEFKFFAVLCRDETESLGHHTWMLFFTTTMLYFVTNVSIECRRTHPERVGKIIAVFEEEELLQFLTRYIEHWRWNSRLGMRIRNIISLLYKLLMLQFGCIHVFEETKSGIYAYYGLKRGDKGSPNLSVTPLNFQAFVGDITSRFPNYSMELKDFPEPINNSNSLSQFLEIPRSKSRNSINVTLPVPERHLATPAPSPPRSPVLVPLSEGMRTRKSFQTNMAYPYLYPSDDEDDDELTSKITLTWDREHLQNDIPVPYSIEEAAHILANNVEIKLSTRQLWSERDYFMSTERGWKVGVFKDIYDYSKIESDKYSKEIAIMKRVDTYYRDCLSCFNSVVFVLLQTVEANLSNVYYRKTDFPEETYPPELLKPHLEIIKAKETSMKASLGILFLLLKWFKLNHVLKSEQLSVLLYDSHVINISVAILGKFSDIYSDKIFSKTPSSTTSFWKICSLSNATYRDSYSQSVATKEEDNSKDDEENPPRESIDTDFLLSLTYLLKILKKVVGNRAHRLKSLPATIGPLFRSYYRVHNLSVYHPILQIVKELTPFKNKRWKSEHMDLISGVFLYEKLELTDNWITGKDVSAELMDACGQEIALRALLQFYNFQHYQTSMEELGYTKRSDSSIEAL